MKLKGLHFADVAEIQEALTDELRRPKKRNFWQLFRNLYNRTKAYIYANGTYLDKKLCFFLMCLRFKKSSPKTIGPHSVYRALKNTTKGHGKCTLCNTSVFWKRINQT
jgi:hypothetical protein